VNVSPSSVVTVRVSGSTAVTVASLTFTVSSRAKTPRSGRATSGMPSSAVATWYRSGWNWW
jgi:hypothetical protein